MRHKAVCAALLWHFKGKLLQQASVQGIDVGLGADAKAQPDVGTLEVEVSTKADAKVTLDIEDAPFLKEDEKPKESAASLAVDSRPAPVVDEAAQKKKKKMLIMCGAVLLLLVGVAVWWFFVRKPPEPEVVVQPEIIRVPSAPKDAAKPEFIVTFAPYWIELPDNKGGVVFLVCKFAAVTGNETLMQEAQNKVVLLRDAVYYYLKNKPYHFLIDPANAETIKKDLGSVLSGYLAGGKIDDILFESYLGK